MDVFHFEEMITPAFSTAYCSSEDPQHPFNYLFRDDIVSGWVSSPNPRYPIEAIIDMKGKFILNGIEVVSHQYMISGRVDLYGTRDEPLNDLCQWESIGFFQFNDNQRSQWRARELKRIKIDHKTVRFLRIVFQDCHPTPMNQYNQVSLISLEVQGRKDLKPRMTSYEDMINDLESAKIAAVEQENYAAAADYKEELVNIAKNEQEIRNLFQQKEVALQDERYLDVDSIIKRIMAILIPTEQEQYQSEPVQQPEEPQEYQHKYIPEQEPEPEPEQESEPENEQEQINPVADPGTFFLTEFHDDSKIIAPSQEQLIVIDTPEPEPAPPPRKKSKPPKERVPQRQVPDFSKPPPKSDDPDELSDEARAEAEPLIELFGESPIALAYSNSWSSKVNGYKKLCELVAGLKNQNDILKAIRGLTPLMRKRFNDGLKAVYCSAVEETIKMVDSISLPNNEFNIFVHQLLPLAIAKLGDSNQRINESANQFVIWCANKDKFALTEVIQFALKQPSSPNQYHILSAKLVLLKTLIEKCGFAPSGKMKLGEVMKIIVPCLESRKAELRQQAFELLVHIYPIVGSSMEKYMTNVPRLVKEQFKTAVGNE